MKYLFVHQNFPGQFLYLIQRLNARPGNEIVFICEPNESVIPGVRKAIYRLPPKDMDAIHPGAHELEKGLRRAEYVARTARSLKQLGFEPDIIIGHHGWGELLDLVDVFPTTPILGYFEFFYATHDLDVGFDDEFPQAANLLANVRAKNAINLQALMLGQHGQTPTQFQRDTYPDWAQPQIRLIAEGADLDKCRPAPKRARKDQDICGVHVGADEKLVTYVSRDLEPYRGFHVFMRALPRILDERPDARVILVGGDGVSYGARLVNATWRDTMLRELGDRIDPSRVHFVGKVPYDSFRALLKRSDAHVYLTYPFVASWSLREALATGCVVVGSDTAPVSEFVQDGKNGLLVPFLQPERIAQGVLEVLEDQKLARKLSKGARAYAESHLDQERCLDLYEQEIARIVGP
ncbi:glycosyltransferase [Ameyamaea chiangmaiensis NBRC 103196]|uniref:Glycosyltransferase n=1 Tax=Ameyamaea chiangmaiensis TaxID=442969 RepID=A0A850PCT3_9PROT|nr:glycosyltransferase family 4 protein [Ameyamaea chiangmaiensis]MBS4075783.1 glycosyltransferase family 4 protein [Ameyamaea chiangmaiensis]NVN41944.1 glycosyltransferase [Ameyamaea chiangmaiensis]GBQ63729.1 glycosyltransferase [Ameyamaea chiangmaiensis NBRC 103196]